MALRDNILHVIYKLNGVENDVETTNITESSSNLASFDKIDLYRYSNMRYQLKKNHWYLFCLFLLGRNNYYK